VIARRNSATRTSITGGSTVISPVETSDIHEPTTAPNFDDEVDEMDEELLQWTISSQIAQQLMEEDEERLLQAALSDNSQT
jgi:hypothetical protein